MIIKKMNSILAFALIVVGLCGCGTTSDKVVNGGTAATDETVEAEEVVEKEDAVGAEDTEETIQEMPEYPKIVYVDSVLYYGTDEVCEIVPRKAPDGIIETFVPEEIMPDAYNSANFGSEQGSLEYIFLEDGQLIVHIGEEWFYFEMQ